MKQIRLAFVDFPGPHNPDALLKLMRKHFDIVVDQERPRYVFYSVFGTRYLEYPGAIRIFFTGENVHPDFNLCDYAFGFDWMAFEDRYCRCPNYMIYEEFDLLRRRPRIPDVEVVLGRKAKFCNFIYSNARAHPYRENLFRRLQKYKTIDSAGIYLNNTGFTVGSPALGSGATRNKIDFQRLYKFSIAVENSSSIGYTTEKLVHALAADTVPIYWGNPEVGREFNTRRFINCHEYGSLEEVVARVEEIDKSDETLGAVLSESVFPDDRVPDALREDTIVAQLRHIFSQEDNAGRRNPYVWGKLYEERRRLEAKPPTFGRLIQYKRERAINMWRRISAAAGRLLRRAGCK